MAEKSEQKEAIQTRAGGKATVIFDFERELRMNSAMKRGWNSEIRVDSRVKLVEYSKVCDIVIRYKVPLTAPSARVMRDLGCLKEWLKTNKVPYDRIEMYFGN